MYRLNLDREWRIGATANRIISLAYSNGSSFRTFCEGKVPAFNNRIKKFDRDAGKTDERPQCLPHP